MSENFYKHLNWKTILSSYKNTNDFDINEYHKILSPDFPGFLNEYIKTKSMQRLKGIGLLCGTDWTKLYKNRFYYSRFDHSLGVALIIWHFTKDKTQTLAGLFHDISTGIFSHVQDFRNGDALTQTDSENMTEYFISKDKDICSLLQKDNISIKDVCDYHKYSVCDNEIPQLAADRLEYMFPSGASLQGSWTLNEIRSVYKDLTILKNESNINELGFKSIDKAVVYTKKFLETGHILQLNENKLSLQMLAEITKQAISNKYINENECFTLTEKQAMNIFKSHTENKNFTSLIQTFSSMQNIEHTQEPLKNHYCVSLKVKQRYINPLVITNDSKIKRISEVSEEIFKLQNDFLSFSDTKYGCVKLI